MWTHSVHVLIMKALTMIHNAPSLDVARELADIVMDSKVKLPLMELIRSIWDHRHEVPLASLDGKDLTYTIKRETTPPTHS